MLQKICSGLAKTTVPVPDSFMAGILQTAVEAAAGATSTILASDVLSYCAEALGDE
jgi:hypothetical protein